MRRQARWVELMPCYTYNIKHRAGKLNVADCLARRPDLLPCSAFPPCARSCRCRAALSPPTALVIASGLPWIVDGRVVNCPCVR
jgi:hypothetical protein